MAKQTGLAQATNKPPANPEAWINAKPSAATEKATRLVVEIPADLHRQLKGRCGMEGIKIKDVIQSLLEQYLSGKIAL